MTGQIDGKHPAPGPEVAPEPFCVRCRMPDVIRMGDLIEFIRYQWREFWRTSAGSHCAPIPSGFASPRGGGTLGVARLALLVGDLRW